MFNTPCTLCHFAKDTEAPVCHQCPLSQPQQDNGQCEPRQYKINIASGEDALVLESVQ